jgi:hypothetical protein
MSETADRTESLVGPPPLRPLGFCIASTGFCEWNGHDGIGSTWIVATTAERG